MSIEFEKHKKKAFLEAIDSPELASNFNVFAQDLNDWAWLSECVPGLVLSSAGGFGNLQAEGLYYGHPWYYSESDGYATLRVAQLHADNAYLPEGTLYTSHEEVENWRKGPGWISSLINLFENLEKAPCLYRFPAKEIGFKEDREPRSPGEPLRVEYILATDRDTHKVGWGHSPEEAYEDTKKIFEHLLSNGWTEEVQSRMWELQRIQRTPINSDERDFSTLPASFEVRVPEVWRDEAGRVTIPEELFNKE